jgi:PadR family transcriptional regulator PadR
VRVERELMRGAGPIAVLRLLEAKEMYGYELAEALSRRTDGVLAIGQSTLYPLLYNLEKKRLIRGRWRESESGRKRKYYFLTKKGSGWLASQRKQWESLVGAMSNLGVVEGGSGRE